jgi:hypothetical protein
MKRILLILLCLIALPFLAQAYEESDQTSSVAASNITDGTLPAGVVKTYTDDLNVHIASGMTDYQAGNIFLTDSFPYAITFSTIEVLTDAGTVANVNLHYVSMTTPTGSGLAVLTSSITTVNANVWYGSSSITRPTIPANMMIQVICDKTTTAHWVHIRGRYTYSR